MPRLKRSRRAVYEPEPRQLVELAWLLAGNAGPVDFDWSARREAARETAWNRLSREEQAGDDADYLLARRAAGSKATSGALRAELRVALAEVEADDERRIAAILAGEDVAA